MVTLLAHHPLFQLCKEVVLLLSLPAKSSDAFYLHILFLFSASWPTQISLE